MSDTEDGRIDRTEPNLKGWQKLLSLLREDTSGIHPRLLIANAASNFLPRHQASALRARVFALVGFRIGEGSRFDGTPRINGGPDLPHHLEVGRDCVIGADCAFDLGEKITIGDRVRLSPGVMILTSTHELDIREHRAGPVQLAAVTIGDGAWVGARAIILPGVTIGDGAIVNPGAVVNKDVAPQTRVGGIPATQLEVLKAHEGSGS